MCHQSSFKTSANSESLFIKHDKEQAVSEVKNSVEENAKQKFFLLPLSLTGKNSEHARECKSMEQLKYNSSAATDNQSFLESPRLNRRRANSLPIEPEECDCGRPWEQSFSNSSNFEIEHLPAQFNTNHIFSHTAKRIPRSKSVSMMRKTPLFKSDDLEDLSALKNDDTELMDIIASEPKVKLSFDDSSVSMSRDSSLQTISEEFHAKMRVIRPVTCSQCGSSHCLSVSKTPGFYHPAQVALHNRADDCWVIAHGIVYDVTRYLSKHPGGVRSILRHAGSDVSKDFDFHTKFTRTQVWGRYAIGKLSFCDGGKNNQNCVIC